MKSASVMRTGTSRSYSVPLTVTVMVRFSLMVSLVRPVPGRVVGKPRGLLQRAARQHRGEMLAVVGRGVDVGHRLDAAAAFANLGEQRARRRLSGDRLLDLGCADRRHRNATDGDGRACNFAAVDLQQGRGRDDGEIA